MNSTTQLLKKSYELLERETPLTFDCGRLCNGYCCKGDSTTGMFLFPGEENLLKNTSGFNILECDGNFGYKMVVCNGNCDRTKRPLACRIYPYFPVINGDTFDVRADIRGINSCPLLKQNIKVNYSFISQIRKIARMFAANDELKSYIASINSLLDEIEYLAERIV